MTISNPISFILHHQQAIMPVHYRNGQKTSQTWNCLKKDLPELQQVMKFNTFKQYLSVITAVTNQLGDDNREKKAVRQGLSNSFREEKNGLDKVRQETIHPPRRILGWNVRKAGDGYYRCYRKIHNQVHSIYIGKQLDVEKAQHRIKEKERKLRLDNS